MVTRRREKTAHRTVPELRRRPHDRAALIPVGQCRSTPCQPPLRLVSVRWPGVGYRDLTKGREPQVLSARQVGALARRRWRLEAAVALTKRLLAVADVWTGSTPAGPWQIAATLIV